MSLNVLYAALVVLIILSAFFSSSETGMLSLNRYRLRHKSNKGDKNAKRVSELLDRPDRLIGVILIGNNLVNVSAASIMTIVCVRLFGDYAGPAVATFGLTMILLVFAEVTPKTLAAFHPERIAFPASVILKPLLTLLYPAVVVVNALSNSLVRLFGVDPNSKSQDHLHPEELRTVVDEAGDLIPDQHQGMLLNVLDLEKATVEDIMVPRNEVMGIDLEDDMETIMKIIRESEFTRLPVYEGDINKVVGLLHLRNTTRFLNNGGQLTHDDIRETMRELYFVPESTPLHTQLLNFKKEKRRFAIVVDEYGEVQGLATLVDLLEEVVGDFSSETAEQIEQDITQLEDSWYQLDATASVRDVNRNLDWQLPTDGPKTINGLIVEHLESIPDAICSFQIDAYLFEITGISETMIEKANVKQVKMEENAA